MNKLNYLIAILVLSTFTFQTSAQEDVIGKVLGSQIGVAVKVGTLGPGLEVSTKLNALMNLRVGVNYLPLHFTTNGSQLFDFNGAEKISIDTDLKLNTFPLMVDIFPFSKFLAFHVTTGFMVDLNEINVRVYTTETFEFDDRKITPNEAGEVHFNLQTNRINPYLGFGFGNTLPKKRVGLKVELGAMYHGEPKASLNGTGQIEPTATDEENQKIVGELFNPIINHFYPVLSFQLNVRIK
ncbi:MAG: hypothetical protein ACJAZ3_000447 [Sphingobacteriales bacterium]|jgi:hypothetical protein